KKRLVCVDIKLRLCTRYLHEYRSKSLEVYFCEHFEGDVCSYVATMSKLWK
ncbi:hypothetical protein TNCT_202701, partial [Trichonephila clavata]